MSSITLRVSGETARLIRQMRRLSELDRKGANRAIAEALRTSTVERFRNGVAPDGRRWRTSIRASRDGKKTLTDKAKLRNSIRARGGVDGAAVGTNDIRAATHQYGDNRVIRARRQRFLRFQINGKWIRVKKVRVIIPARPFLGMSDEDQEEIKYILDEMMGGS